MKAEAMENGYSEAISLTHEGHVCEGSAENLFIWHDSQLVTPPVTDNILVGITRSTILQLAREELGLECVERSIDRTELYVCEEVFLCGTGVEMTPVVEIDRRPVGTGKIGPISRKLTGLYQDVVHGRVAKYRDWCAPVYTQAPAAAGARAD